MAAPVFKPVPKTRENPSNLVPKHGDIFATVDKILGPAAFAKNYNASGAVTPALPRAKTAGGS
jgi:hypothetical protein